jgi:hypothetical protein
VVFTSPSAGGDLVGESPLAPSSALDRLVNPDQC